jgi:SAM-dependent methyltransferase
MKQSDHGDPGERSVDKQVDERVKELYMRYPYPSAQTDTGVALFALLDYVRYLLWPGRPNLDGLRILDAGCGTGHTAVQIARQHPQVRVVGIDISSASLDVARNRAQAAGLIDETRLTFRQASIDDLSPEEQQFDYVISSGVLHHLADPVDGARRLARLLTPTGGIGIMVYAPHGRHGVYLLQEALRRLLGDRDLSEQVVVARQLLAGLPQGHPFKPAQFSDQDWADDAGLVDLLLHVRDRSFSVPALFDLLEQSGLRLERFFSPLAYRPENHTSDPSLKQRLSLLDDRAGAIMAELLCGVMPMHACFATRAGHRPTRLLPTDLTLMLMRPRRSPLFRWDNLRLPTDRDAKSKAHGRRAPRTFPVAERNLGPLSRTFEFDEWIANILNRCDGSRTTKEILGDPAVVAGIPGVSPEQKSRVTGPLLKLLAQQELLLFDI